MRDSTETGKENGWGGWTRTNEWQDQNLLPYHLATPQLLTWCWRR